MKTILFHPERDADAIRRPPLSCGGAGCWASPRRRYTVWGRMPSTRRRCAIFSRPRGRPQDNPLIIHVPDASWLERYCREVPETAYRLAERFWPGPLTMILPRRENVPLQTTGGLETVGVPARTIR